MILCMKMLHSMAGTFKIFMVTNCSLISLFIMLVFLVVFDNWLVLTCTDSIGSGVTSNLSSPGVIQQQRASLLESVSTDMSAASVTQPGLYL